MRDKESTFYYTETTIVKAGITKQDKHKIDKNIIIIDAPMQLSTEILVKAEILNII